MRGIKTFAFLLGLYCCSCRQYDVPETYQVTFKVNYPELFDGGKSVKNVTVKTTNIQTGREYTQTTNSTGTALFDVRGGNYNIMVSFSEERDVNIDGFVFKRTVQFNGAVNSQAITANGNILTIPLQYSIVKEGFVIKELYTSGSLTPAGKSYGADKFYEIYNNSDKVLYSDGLCYGAVYPTTTNKPTPYLDANGKLLDRIPVWSFVAIVPGTGKEHPIQPGKSFVVALSGLNHKADPNGNPNSIDLSHADWEMYVDKGMYVDVPSVPNILMQRITAGTAMSLDVNGQVSILFRLPEGDLQSIFTDTNNYLKPVGSSFSCFMVHKSWVIDGVENARLSPDGVYKRLHDEIDVSYIQHRGGSETVSVKRKVSEVVNGHTIYKDTNNSAEDFLTNQVPTPGIIAKN
jgi:hypothetical protein